MPARHSTRRKKPGLIRGAATKVTAVATAVGSRIGATVRAPAMQIATLVHDTAQRLPVIGSAPKRARAKTKSSAKAKRHIRSRTRRTVRN